LRCTECEGHRRLDGVQEDCQRCYWDQGNALTDQFYISSVKPFSYICAVFLVASYVIGLWFSLRTHAAQIWETQPTQTEYNSLQRSTSLTNWRRNIPDEPFLKRIGERISTRFLRGEQPHSPPAETDPGANGTARRFPSNSERLSSLGSSLTHDESTAFVRNVAEVAAAAATLAVQNSQTPTPQPTPRAPPHELGPKDPRPHLSSEWEDPEALVTAVGHDAPNWSRTKSSIILLSATILYAVIAGKILLFEC
jgi:Ca2+:H+ antiporter